MSAPSLPTLDSAEPFEFILLQREVPSHSPLLARLCRTISERMANYLRPRVIIDPSLNCWGANSSYIALDRLYNTHGQFYGHTVVTEYLEALHDIYPLKFRYSPSGVRYSTLETPLKIAETIHKEISNKLEVTDIAIPYDDNQHHIVIYIDRKRKQIEYYDPLAESCTEEMKNHLLAIQKLFFEGANSTLVQNKIPHQTCCFRCALWGLYFIQRRLGGASFELFSDERPTTETIEAFKINEVAHKIQERAYRLLRTPTRS